MESSRIFVRGLPPKFTEDDFRKHFARFPVTDVKLFPQRRIGYVGYKTPEDAARAVRYFNKSFIRMSKIYAEAARPIADERLPKSHKQWKAERAAAQATEYVPPAKENTLKRKRDHGETALDPKLKEFLEVMQPPSKSNLWANEEAQHEPAREEAEAVEPLVVPEGESDDEYQVVQKKAKPSTSARDVEAEAKPAPEDPILDAKQDEREEPDDMTSNQGDAGEQPPVSDADWLRSHTKRALELGEDEDEHKHVPDTAQPQEERLEPEEDDEMEADEAPAPEEANAHDASAPTEADKIRETGRLYLRNLSYAVTEDDIRDHFAEYGSLQEVHVPVNKSTGAGKGFAFVQFKDTDQAAEAFTENDGKVFQGRLLHIISARVKKDPGPDEFAISKLPLKKQREIKRKADASSSTFNWNSLYLNADAVMSTVADRLGISKSELLDPTSSDAAVKQAHAETHIIQETKAYFAQHGVDLEAFKRSAKGDTAILVKNIPHAATTDELRKLFEEHGTISKFLMPPAGMTAVVEFSNPAQTKSAFRSLAYRKIKDSVLFLEKAPKDLFKEGVTAPVVSQALPTEKATSKLSATDLLREDTAPEVTNTATLYVRNLNFSTTTERLKDTFSPLAGFRSAKVQTKTDPKRGVLSMGYAFVEFDSAESASAALRTMDGHNLEGHQITIRASHKGADAAEERRKEDAAKKAAGTKIIIKNLPFEASKKDIRALFAPYGQLRSVRVPKKFDNHSRGFGFADFTTKRDAANAMDALRNTHLLGRKLVLAFAEAESDDPEKELERMQQKVGSQTNKVALQRLTGGGRKKFNVAGTDDLDEA